MDVAGASGDTRGGEGTGRVLGTVIAVEDVDTHSLQRRYSHMLGVIILGLGLIALAWGMTVVATYDDDDESDSRPTAVLALCAGTVGAFMCLAGPRYISKSLHMRPTQYLDTGVQMTVRAEAGGWREEVRGWDQMGRYHRTVHWFMGPAIVVDVGLPGDDLIVPESLGGFDRVERLLERNLDEASGAWELFD